LVHFGEYRTKRLILEIYDRMAAAIADGPPFDTVLDPPPDPVERMLPCLIGQAPPGSSGTEHCDPYCCSGRTVAEETPRTAINRVRIRCLRAA
jgi:hypothetical protein